MASALLDAIDDVACLLDGAGAIVDVNEAWTAVAPSASRDRQDWRGVDYLEACERTDGPSSDGSSETAAGLRELLAGERDALDLVYCCPVGDRTRWFRLRARRVGVFGVAALVVHEDVTTGELWRRHVEQRFASLSAREREVLELLVRGRSSREISAALGVAQSTIENHRRRIMTKTAAANVAELVRLAIAGKAVPLSVPMDEAGPD